MSRILQFFFAVLGIAGLVNASNFGVDISGPTSSSALQCIGGQRVKNEDNMWLNTVVRIGHYSVGYDEEATRTLNSAGAATINEVDGYIELCPKKQLNTNVADYVNDIFTQLKNFDVYDYVQSVYLTVKNDTDGKGDCWSNDSNVNIQSIADALHSVAMNGRKVGILTNNEQWNTITNNYTGLSSDTLLWWASPGEPTFSDFVAFGVWKQAKIRQFLVSTASQPVKRCGLIVNKNFAQDDYWCQQHENACDDGNKCCEPYDCDRGWFTQSAYFCQKPCKHWWWWC